MKKWQFIFLAALLGGVAGCGGGGGGGDGGVEEIIRQAEQTSGRIAAIGEEALVEGTPEALAQAATTLGQEAGVAAATATTHSLTVEYENGGTEMWVVTPPRAEPVPVAGGRAAPPARELVGSERAVIFNALDGDSQFAASNLKTAEAGDILQGIGYTVDRHNGTAASVESYKGLAPYGVVVFDGHGATTTFLGQAGVVLQTGQEGSWGDLLLDYALDWVRGRVTLMNVRWGVPATPKRFLAVTDRFFSGYYLEAEVPLPHSLVYSAACSTLNNYSLADVLYDSGAAVYVGWTAPQGISSWTLVSMFEGMTDGTDLATALAALPDNLKHDTDPDSWLGLYTLDGGTIQLRRAASIAFASWRDGNFEIYVMNPDGTNQTNLTNNPADDGAASWSPDGSKIAFHSEPGWYRVILGGNRVIYVMNSDGSNQTNLTNNLPSAGYPSWSPDGTKIAFDVASKSKRDANYEIYVVNSNGGNQTNLTNNPAMDTEPSWSPDGRKIAFTSLARGGDARGGNPEIYLMNSDGSNQTNLTNNAEWDCIPSWSPDGRKIAFWSKRDGNWEIYVMNSDGTNQTNLTNNPADDRSPSWSPDGRRIAFSSDRDGEGDIYVMNSDGTDQTNLTNNAAEDNQPSWSAF